jgi:NADH-quinone oxidoreductase subunit N
MGPQIDLSVPGGLALAIMPELVLTGWSLVLALVVAWRHKGDGDQRFVGQLAVVGLLLTLAVVLGFWLRGVSPAGHEEWMALDRFRYLADTIFLLGAILAALLSLGYLGRERVHVPEFYLLLLLATVGMMFMGGSTNLVLIFIGLELMSLCVYVLAGIDRRSVFAAEASLKYFLLGAFASGFLLYGIALIYGATGTTDVTLMYARIMALGLESNTMLLIGTGMLLVGFAFKVAAVPFHMWTPDVYDGAPTPITAFMAAAVKAAAFAALIRVLLQGLGPVDVVWTEVVWWLAAVTMVVGNLIALVQPHIKRMLAYSSIGHAGYLLAAVAAGTEFGAAAFLFYVLAYTLMTVGAFAVLTALGRRGERDVRVDDLNGLAKRRPWMAAAMTIFMLSLLGFPGTAGFIGKWLILSAAVQSGQGSLAVILVVSTVISAGFYLPVIMAMYMKPPATDTVHEEAALVGASRWVVAALAVCLLLFGVWPNRLLDMARQGTEDLRPSVMMTVSQ